jgi:hypothetical protein
VTDNLIAEYPMTGCNRLGYNKKKLRSGRFGTRCTWQNTYLHENEFIRNPNSDTLDLDTPQHDRRAASVSAQQCSSFTFVSLCFHFRKELFKARFENVVISILVVFFLNCVTLVLRYMQLPKGGE